MNAISALKNETKVASMLGTKTIAKVVYSPLNFQSIYTLFINQLGHFRKKNYFKLRQPESGQHTVYQYKTNTLSIEIGSKKMEELLAFHHICAADIHCLNANSKQCLQKLCLKTCLKNRHCNQLPDLLDNN